MSFWVYVIELEDAVWGRKGYREQNPTFGQGEPPERFFYVGQTSLEPRERFQQHQDGIRSSRIVRSHGRWLRSRLCRSFETREEALEQEVAIAQQLREKGWAAYSN